MCIQILYTFIIYGRKPELEKLVDACDDDAVDSHHIKNQKVVI